MRLTGMPSGECTEIRSIIHHSAMGRVALQIAQLVGDPGAKPSAVPKNYGMPRKASAER